MMGFRTAGIVTLAMTIACALGSEARAEEAYLHHAQSGALLAYAETEMQIIYGTLLSKEFDPELAKTLAKELDRSLSDAKKAVDRTRLVAGEDKLEPDFTKMLDIIRRAEKQLSEFSTDIEEQTGTKEAEPTDHREDLEAAGESKAPKGDWNLLKRDAAWLNQDIKDARAQHAAIGKKLKGGPLKPLPKPAGKRDEKGD
jgi:hypothetical protein